MRKQLLIFTLLFLATLLGRAQNGHYSITILPPDTNWGENRDTTSFSNACRSWRGTLYWNDLLFNPLGDFPREWFHVVEYQGDFYLSKYYPYSIIFTDGVIIYNGMDWGFSAFADFRQDKDLSYHYTAFQTRQDSTVAAYHQFIKPVPGHEGLFILHKDYGDEYELVTNCHYLKNFKILDEHFDENGDWEFRPPYYPQPDLDDLFSSRNPLDTTAIVVTPQLAQTMRKAKVSRKRPLTDFYFWPNGTALYCKQNKCGVIKYNGEILIPSEYQSISLLEDLFILSKNCKKKQPIPICSEGLADKNGEILIPCDPNNITFYFEDTIVTVLQKNKDSDDADIHYYNTQTKEFCAKPTYDIFPGYHATRNYPEKDSLFDGAGNLILSDYDGIFFEDGIAFVRKDVSFGAVNQNGKTLLPCIYDDIMVKDDILIVKKDDKVAFANFNGEFITPFMERDNWSYTHSGLIINNQRSADGSRLLKGVVNGRGKVVVPCQYENIEIFHDAILLEKDGKYGFCDHTGNIIAPCIYDFHIGLGDLNSPNIPAGLDGQWGLINRQNEVIIPFQWDDVQLYGDLALVQKDGLCGCVNFDQDTIIPIWYDEIITNPAGLFAVIKDSKMGIIDTFGHLIVPCIYEYDEEDFWLWRGIEYIDNLFITLKKGGKFGAVNTNGKVVIPFVYDELGIFFGEDIQMVPARKGRRVGYVDRFGNSTFTR